MMYVSLFLSVSVSLCLCLRLSVCLSLSLCVCVCVCKESRFSSLVDIKFSAISFIGAMVTICIIGKYIHHSDSMTAQDVLGQRLW